MLLKGMVREMQGRLWLFDDFWSAICVYVGGSLAVCGVAWRGGARRDVAWRSGFLTSARMRAFSIVRMMADQQRLSNALAAPKQRSSSASATPQQRPSNAPAAPHPPQNN